MKTTKIESKQAYVPAAYLLLTEKDLDLMIEALKECKHDGAEEKRGEFLKWKRALKRQAQRMLQ